VTKAAVYLRVSTSEQAEGGVSLDQQRAMAERYCEARGWALVAEYQDVMSGTKDARPALRRLEADARSKAFSVVLVYRVDRLARSFRKAARVMGELGDHGVALVSMTEQLDLTTPIGQSIFGLLAGWAEQESLNTGQRVSDAKRHQALAGVWQSHKVPLGYRYVGKAVTGPRLVPDERWGPVVVRIFEAYAAGQSIHAITRDLNAEGAATPSGAQWWPETIRHIVRNESYTGCVVSNRRRHKRDKARNLPPSVWVRSPASHEAIIPPELWAAAAARTADLDGLHPSQVRARAVSPWTGLVVCAGCGRNLHRAQIRYRCEQAHCPARAGIAVSWLDGKLWPALAELLERAHETEPAATRRAEPKAKPEKEIQRQRERIERAQAGYLAGLLSIERATSERAEAESRIAALLSTAEPAKAALPAELRDLAGHWDYLTPAERGEMLRVILRRVEIDSYEARAHVHPFSARDWPSVLVLPIKRWSTYKGG